MNKIQKYIFGALSIIGVIIFFVFFGNIVAYILIAAVLSMMGRPVVNLLTKIRIKKLHMPRWLASLLTIALFIAIITSFLRLIIPLVGNQISEFSKLNTHKISENLEDPYQKIDNFVHDTGIASFKDFSSREFISQKIINLVHFDKLSDVINTIGSAVGSLIMGVFSVFFISFFFMKDSNLFDKMVLMLVPDEYEERVKNTLEKIKNLISRYFIGLLFQIIGVCTLVTIGLSIIGIEFQLAILVGIIAGFMNLIPYIGPWIGATIGTTLVIAGNIEMDFYSELLPMLPYVILTFVATQMTDVFVFQPTIFSNSVRAHPLEIFVVILVGASLAGIVGMLLAIPTYTVIRVIAKEFFSQSKFIRSLTKNMDKKKK